MPRTAALALAWVLALSLAGPLPSASAEPVAPPEPAGASLVQEAPAEDTLAGAEALLEPVAAADDGGVEREATLALRDLWLARPDLSGADRRRADALLARPTVPGDDTYASYQPGTPTSQACGPRVCVTYVTTTDDRATQAWAEQVLATMESAWTREVDELGYRPPAADGQDGGDARFDVYLANISRRGLYGYCAPEARVAGQPGRAQSYCVLDNDMAGFSMGPQESLAVTAAHEFFHAIQFNIDAAEDQWFMEASATWMEELVVDAVDDNRQFLEAGQLGTPGLPLDSWASDLAMYGNWIFVQRIAQSLGVDAVRGIWERLDASVGAPDEYSVQGIRNYTSSRNRRWGRWYARFVESNLMPRRAYAEGRAYESAPVARKVRLTAGDRSHRLTSKVRHLSSSSVQVRAGRGLGPRSRLLVRVRARTGRGATPVVRALVFKEDGGLSRVDVGLDRRGRGSQRVSLRRGKVRRVVVVLVNASTRYRRCGLGSPWACGGRPADDGQRFTVRLRATR